MNNIAKLMIFLCLSLSSFAYNWFPVQSFCQLTGGVGASCQVCNYQGYRPIFCVMNINGSSAYGAYFNGHQRGLVYPGLCMNGFVRAYNPYRDPLVSANAVTQCRF